MRAIIAIALAAAPVPAFAQAMDHSMHHPSAPKDQAMPGMDMSAPVQAPASDEPAGTDQPVGSAEPPPVEHDRPADHYWDPAAMAAAEQAEMHPPRPSYARLTFDLAEHQFRQGRDGYRWEGEAWLGDLDRFVVKTKGEGTSGTSIDQFEVQALYAKALDPWWNLQFGVRQDIRPRPARSWATVGIEGRAPYQFDVQAAAFLSSKGEITGRIEAAYDQRITQRLILQPRIEFDLSAQDMPGQRIGAGLSSAELGLRLRYELRREFAPYVGVNWTWTTGQTAAYARTDGKDPREHSVVAGIRFWF